MKLPAPLREGRLLRRYQRFFAEVDLGTSVVVAHTPNTGSMLQCAVPGARVLLSEAADPKRKLAWTLELVEVGQNWVDINTHRTNRVVEEALRVGMIAELSGYSSIRPEAPFGSSRLDFRLEGEEGGALVEVKNVTYCSRPGLAGFPDAVTARGLRHLRELEQARQQGLRAVMLFVVQRADAEAFAPAAVIDPAYTRGLAQAAEAGVELLAYRTVVTPWQVVLGRRLPVYLDANEKRVTA